MNWSVQPATPQVDVDAILRSQWMNPEASVAQPMAMPAMQMAPMSTFDSSSFTFGGGANGAGAIGPVTRASIPVPSMSPQVDLLNPTLSRPTARPTTATGGGFKNWISDGNNLGTVVQGLGSLTSAYLGFKQLSQAKDQLRFQKDAFNKNFANQQKSYNTSLEDRIRGRSSNPNESDVQAYLSRHRLGGN